jgi:hypothetical protein
MRMDSKAVTETTYRPAGQPARLSSSVERFALWFLRAALASAAVLCGVLVFWLWFDNVYGPSICGDVGGLLLLVSTGLLTRWAWRAW